MDLNTDGSDGDHQLPDRWLIATFQPQTSYRWPQTYKSSQSRSCVRSGRSFTPAQAKITLKGLAMERNLTGTETVH